MYIAFAGCWWALHWIKTVSLAQIIQAHYGNARWRVTAMTASSSSPTADSVSFIPYLSLMVHYIYTPVPHQQPSQSAQTSAAFGFLSVYSKRETKNWEIKKSRNIWKVVYSRVFFSCIIFLLYYGAGKKKGKNWRGMELNAAIVLERKIELIRERSCVLNCVGASRKRQYNWTRLLMSLYVIRRSNAFNSNDRQCAIQSNHYL